MFSVAGPRSPIDLHARIGWSSWPCTLTSNKRADMSPKKKKKQNIIFIVHPPHTCHKIITNIGHLFKAQSAFEKETSIWRSRKNSWFVCGYRCSLRGSSTDNPYLYQLHNCFVAILHFLLLWWNQQSLRLKNLNCQKPKPKISFRIRSPSELPAEFFLRWRRLLRITLRG